MIDLQQSPLYARYITKLKWKVETLDGVNIFVRTFIFMGTFVKIQRMNHLPDIDKVKQFLINHQAKFVVLEPGSTLSQKEFYLWAAEIKKITTVMDVPYLPTKTIRILLEGSEEEIFKRFSEAKRRAVRRAIKNEIVVEESDQIRLLIKVKNKSAGLFGFITTSGLKELWEAFRPQGATIVLAYQKDNTNPIAGIILIFWEKTAYYWIAGSSKQGKKLFAPTLLVWEAMKISKQHGMTSFDFVGVWDERFPKENKDWLGFTKFKEGFGGKEFYYATHRKVESTLV